MINLMKRVAALTAASLLVAACALGGGENRYRLVTLQIEPPASASEGAVDRTLAVARPEADRTRDSTRILVRRDRTLLPWSGAAWIDRAPDLVQDLLVEFLDGRVATVGRFSSLPASHRLDLVLRRFEWVEVADSLHAEVVLVARLFEVGGDLMAVTKLEEREPAAGGSLDQAMAAMETAMSGTFGTLSEWLASRLPPPSEPEASPAAQ